MKRILIAATALLAALFVPGPVTAQDCTTHLCGLSAGTMTGLRNSFVDKFTAQTSIDGAKTYTGNATFDDGTGASPSITLTDATDETAVLAKADAGNTTLTIVAGDDFEIVTGNLKVGNATPTVTQGGEDFFVEGTSEFDGAARFDGTIAIGATTIDATALEINAVADVSSRIVTLTATTAITVALHEGRTLLLGEVGGNAAADMTLPEATGSGARFYFIVSVANTSGYEVQVATDDIFDGSVVNVDGDLADTVNAVHDWTASDSDTINWDSDLTCGDVGDWVEFVDILTGIYAVKGVCRTDGTAYTTMWSADQS